MDLIYIVGSDPTHNYLELRYSIRSMVKHLDKIGKLVIVGECPAFLKVIHIPVPDPHKFNPARNIYEKILAACSDKRISTSFLCCSDDYFLLRDFSSENFPFFFDGDLEAMESKLSRDSNYKPYVTNTLQALKDRSLPLLYYNVHAPMIYSKALFKKVMPAFNWDIKKGYISKSLYANSAGVTGQPEKDTKIYTPKTRPAIVRKISGAPFFSTNEHSVNAEMKSVLQSLYPEPSRWEQ